MTWACSASAGMTGSQVALLLVIPWISSTTGSVGITGHPVGDPMAVQRDVGRAHGSYPATPRAAPPRP